MYTTESWNEGVGNVPTVQFYIQIAVKEWRSVMVIFVGFVILV